MTAGLGRAGYQLAFCINNRPALAEYESLTGLRELQPGELHYLVSRCSNHWRKLFNVYAKFLFELEWPLHTGNPATTWQAYRDEHLLQPHSCEALLFTPPPLNSRQVHIVAGKTYAASLPEASQLARLDSSFACHPDLPWFVSPYLDYRQLSNERISRLVTLVKPVLQGIRQNPKG